MPKVLEQFSGKRHIRHIYLLSSPTALTSHSVKQTELKPMAIAFTSSLDHTACGEEWVKKSQAWPGPRNKSSFKCQSRRLISSWWLGWRKLQFREEGHTLRTVFRQGNGTFKIQLSLSKDAKSNWVKKKGWGTKPSKQNKQVSPSPFLHSSHREKWLQPWRQQQPLQQATGGLILKVRPNFQDLFAKVCKHS